MPVFRGKQQVRTRTVDKIDQPAPILRQERIEIAYRGGEGPQVFSIRIIQPNAPLNSSRLEALSLSCASRQSNPERELRTRTRNSTEQHAATDTPPSHLQQCRDKTRQKGSRARNRDIQSVIPAQPSR